MTCSFFTKLSFAEKNVSARIVRVYVYFGFMYVHMSTVGLGLSGRAPHPRNGIKRPFWISVPNRFQTGSGKFKFLQMDVAEVAFPLCFFGFIMWSETGLRQV